MALSPTEEQVLEAATLFGWRTAHFRPLLTKHGWRTPVSGDGAGFPDFVLARDGLLVFVECKGESNPLEPEQVKWQVVLERAHERAPDTVLYAVIRPADVDGFVKDVLARARR